MMPDLQVGMNVTVDLSGFTKNGVSLGRASTAGTIVAMGYEGITVQLHATVEGVSVVTVPFERVAVARLPNSR